MSLKPEDLVPLCPSFDVNDIPLKVSRAEYATQQGWKDWRFGGVADRAYLERLEREGPSNDTALLDTFELMMKCGCGVNRKTSCGQTYWSFYGLPFGSSTEEHLCLRGALREAREILEAARKRL